MNNIIKLFDNVASLFSYTNGTIVPSGPTQGYNPIGSGYIGSRVSYLARNIFNNGDVEFESGIGTIVSSGTGLAIQRQTIASSSNNNNIVSFSTAGTKAVYIVPNEINNKNAFNNFVNTSGSFSIDSYRATYVIDLSSVDSSGTLPPSLSENAGLIIDFKTQDTNNHSLTIFPSGSQTIDELSSYIIDENDYVQFLSTGSGWISLAQNIIVQSGTPHGQSYSLQINDGNGGFEGSNLFTNNNHDLLIGDKSTYTSILRASGNTEFNLNNGSYNFIVNGKAGKNLVFDSDGKLGINMPASYAPQVPLHILQTACAESIRVENRHSSNPSVFTLYHRPTTVPSVGSSPSIINLAGKNDSANQVNYAVIKSKILDVSSAGSQGAIAVDVNDNGSPSNILDISTSYTKIGYNNTASDSSVIVGRNNNLSGTNNILFGQNIIYSGINSTVIGNNNNHLLLTDTNILIKNSGYPELVVSEGRLGVGKNPSSSLDINGDIRTSGIVSDEYKFSTTSTDGQLVLTSGQNIYPSNYNINNLIVGNNSGLLIKNGDVTASGLDNIYMTPSGLTINNDVFIPSLTNNYLLTLSNSQLSNYTAIELNASNIKFDKNIKVNTDVEYTINSNEPDIFTDGYVVTSGLVIDRASTMPSGAMLMHMGNGVAQWKTVTGSDLIFSNSELSWNKYAIRNATINSSTQITITSSISAEEFVTGDTVVVIKDNTTYYTTITSQSVVAGQTVLIVSAMGVSSGSATIYSATRGGYLLSSVTNGATTNRFSIRPGTPSIFNTGKAEIDFGIYGAATNYALYINANYLDNSEDESQVVINGSIPYSVGEQQYAALTVRGYLYAEQLRVSGDVDIDCGVIVFTGVPS
jgi:hypothetical protein